MAWALFLAVYGVSGTHNDVEISIWDRVYYIENKIVHFEAPIDLNKNRISGLGDGTKNDHAVNLKQLNAVESQVTTVNNKVTKK